MVSGDLKWCTRYNPMWEKWKKKSGGKTWFPDLQQVLHTISLQKKKVDLKS